MTYAIDFGTSNTVIARWNSITEEPEIVSIPRLSQSLQDSLPIIPSLVYVRDACHGEITLGQEVRDLGLDTALDSRFFRSFKRGIGASIQGFLPELDGIRVTFESVGEWFLTSALEGLKASTAIPESLVLTVPVDSFETYRNWLSGVCQSWGIDKVRMVDEPTAAALGYGATEDSLILVVDFGGGTIDLSLVKLDLGKGDRPQGFILKWGEKLLGEKASQKAKVARVLAKAGLNLGGSDLDNWLVDYFSDTQDLPKSPLTVRLAERLKIKLSSQVSASEVYFNDETLDTYELELDQDGFEKILRDNQFFSQLDDLMSKVLQQGRRNGIEVKDIDRVLLVGGTVQIPAVQNWVRQYFDEGKIRSDRPFEAISFGALQLAQGFEVEDFLYHSYGIRYWNRRKNCHDWHSIIKSGQPYPTNSPVELYLGASVSNQPSIELILGELGDESSTSEIFFDGERLVSRSIVTGERSVIPLNDRDGARTIARLNPLGNPGSDRIKLEFSIDRERFLRITVEDLLTEEVLLSNQIVTQLS